MLRARLRPPQVPSDLVVRKRLIDRLERTFMLPLTVVRAAGGYGKTTLLASWIPLARCKVAWLTLTESEDDLLALAIGIAAAIERVVPNRLQPVVPLLRLADPPPALLGIAFAEAMTTLPEHLTLVLDDAQVITSPAARTFLSALIDHVPPKFHVMLAGRMVPDLPVLGKLAELGLMDTITETELRFTSTEGHRFLGATGERGRRSVAHLRTVLEQAEGWPAGLRLASIGKNGDGAVNPANAHTILNELLGREPEAVRTVLLGTAGLEMLTPSLAAEVIRAGSDARLSTSEVRALLEELVERRMFVTRAEDAPDWYRVHQLLREELLEHLRADEGAAGLSTRARAASAWFAANGDIERAVAFALQAGDPEDAADLVERHALSHVDAAPWEEIALLLRRLPHAIVERRTALLALKANVLSEEGRLLAAEATLDRLESVLAARGERAEGLLRGEIDGCRAYDRAGLYGTIESLPFAEAVLANPQASAHARATAIGSTMLGMQALGRTAEAEALAASVPALDDAENRIGAAIQNISAIIYHATAGDFEGMVRIARQAEAHAAGGSHYLREIGLTRVGTYDYYRGDPASAEPRFQAVAPVASFVIARFEANVGLALALRAVGRCSEAQQVANHLVALVSASGDNAYEGHARSFAARLAMMDGDQEAAEAWLAENPAGSFPPLLSMFEHPRLTRAQIRLGRRFHADHLAAFEEATAVHDWAVSHHDVGLASRAALVVALAMATLDDIDGAVDLLERTLVGQFGRMHGLLWDAGPRLRPLLAALAARGGTEGAKNAKRFLDAPLPARSPLARARHHSPKKRTSRHGMALSPREEEVLAYLVDRWSNEEIAAELGIAIETVKQHNSAIFEKLGVRGRKQAAEVAKRRAGQAAR